MVKRYSVEGITGNVSQLARHFGVVGVDTALTRVRAGWDIKDAVTKASTSEKRQKCCEQCKAFVAVAAKQCGECGHTFPRTANIRKQLGLG